MYTSHNYKKWSKVDPREATSGQKSNYWAHAKAANEAGVNARGTESPEDFAKAATAHKRAAHLAEKMGRPDRARDHLAKAKSYSAQSDRACDERGRFAAK